MPKTVYYAIQWRDASHQHHRIAWQRLGSPNYPDLPFTTVFETRRIDISAGHLVSNPPKEKSL